MLLVSSLTISNLKLIWSKLRDKFRESRILFISICERNFQQLGVGTIHNADHNVMCLFVWLQTCKQTKFRFSKFSTSVERRERKKKNLQVTVYFWSRKRRSWKINRIDSGFSISLGCKFFKMIDSDSRRKNVFSKVAKSQVIRICNILALIQI